MADEATGSVLADRYELESVLGRGGSATVFRAHDRTTGERVAVKRFVQGVLGVDQRRRQHEVLALERLDHSGLVSLRDVGTDDDGHAYLVMQLVEGPSLGERLESGPLGAEATVRVGAVLAEALAYVHDHGIVHRDVKPANVLLAGGERPLLTDFGIAQLVDTTRLTGTGLMVGTAGYLAPEQVRGAPVDSAADVYALGLVLLESVTGRAEYPGAALEAAVARLHRRPAVPADLPGPLASLLHRMTATDPTARPTAGDVTTELRAAQDDSATAVIAPVGAAPTRQWPSESDTRRFAVPATHDGYAPGPYDSPTRQRTGRRPVLLAVAGVLAAALIGAGIATAAWFGAGQADPGADAPPAVPGEPAGEGQDPLLPVGPPTDDTDTTPSPQSSPDSPTPTTEPSPTDSAEPSPTPSSSTPTTSPTDPATSPPEPLPDPLQIEADEPASSENSP